MKITTVARAALVGASTLAVLSPLQATAAEAAPGCTEKNIAYLDSQDQQEDAEAKVTTTQQALDQATADRATLDQTAEVGYKLFRSFNSGRLGYVYANSEPVMQKAGALYDAAEKHDPAATADAAVAEADAAQKAIDAMSDDDKKATHPLLLDSVRDWIKELRSKAEAARKATAAPDVEKRQAELDTAIADKEKAAKAVRPARDAYRDCLANNG
ncbi:hypothetical protein [Streptomyces sp. NPDC058045]|uniref:hypothetical protein n=1 Tax=Streptomyces sp. NPDC058045 TaxID=3346311 RepID=UPI0036E1B416